MPSGRVTALEKERKIAIAKPPSPSHDVSRAKPHKLYVRLSPARLSLRGGDRWRRAVTGEGAAACIGTAELAAGSCVADVGNHLDRRTPNGCTGKQLALPVRTCGSTLFVVCLEACAVAAVAVQIKVERAVCVDTNSSLAVHYLTMRLVTQLAPRSTTDTSPSPLSTPSDVFTTLRKTHLF